MKNLTQDLDEVTDSLLDVPASAGPAEVRSAAEMGKQRFDVIDATAIYEQPELLAAWREMLDQGAGPEKLYQSPEFFRYLEAPPGQSKNHMLYVVRRRRDGAYVGIVPARKSEQELAFAFGPIKLARRKLTALQVLGSVPLLARNEPGLASFVFGDLLRRHPDCPVLLMQAVPATQTTELDTLSGVAAYVQNGVRECHTIPLPQNFEAYLQKFSAKKRYNLARQVRLLGEQAGEVQVCRIDEPAHVPGLIDAMRTVLTPQQFALLAKQESFERLAKCGLLHSYVIRCGAEHVAFVLGTRSVDVWHVHNIFALPKYQRLSAGTSAVHLALQDVINNFSFSDADFGYGTPNQDFRSTHVLKARATVLVCRARSTTALLLMANEVYQRVSNTILARVKDAQRRRKQRKPETLPAPSADA